MIRVKRREMPKMKKYLICVLLFVIGISAFGASNLSKAIEEIDKEVNQIEKNIKQYKEVDTSVEGNSEISYYDSSGTLKMKETAYNTFISDLAEVTYYKSGKRIFTRILRTTYEVNPDGSTSDEYKEETEKYYFKRNGELIRYIDKNGRIIDDKDELSRLKGY